MSENADRLYMSAEEATRVLGVAKPTLYAYVSRKQIRSEPVPGTRSRKYWRADIEKLAGVPASDTRPETASAQVFAESSITLITDGGLYFRGRDAIELARLATIESLAALLWQADESTLFATPLHAPEATWPALREKFADVGAAERISGLFPLLERADPRAYDLSAQGFARTGADVLRWTATLAINSARPASGPLHLFVAKALKAPAGFDEVIRTLLLLSADHEFDPITWAVRSVANVGVTPYQAATVGLVASQGQRFQAERYGSCAQFMNELMTEKSAGAVVARRLKNGQNLPGFSVGAERRDPRPGAMLDVLKQANASDAMLRRLLEAREAAQEARALEMEFILPAVFVGRRLGLVGDELAISAIGRTVGWIAHAMEQFLFHKLIRPTSAYVGPLP